MRRCAVKHSADFEMGDQENGASITVKVIKSEGMRKSESGKAPSAAVVLRISVSQGIQFHAL